MFNYSCDIDIYNAWASIVAGKGFPYPDYTHKYYCCCVGRKFNHSYTHSHEEILADLGMASACAHFIGDYMDENVYFNSPLAFLPNLSDPWYLDQYRQSRIIVCAGQGDWEDEMLADTRALESILKQKDIPHWVDIWGGDVNHDWPWWHKMLPYFLDKLQLPGYPG